MKFTKMQGTGNDYILIQDFERRVVRPAALARRMCQQHFGVGADGLILILKSRRADFKMRIFNPDGSEAEMCGNGIRCLGKLVYERGLTRKKELTIETAAGIRTLRLLVRKGKVFRVEVNMGRPGLEREAIPILGQGSPVLAQRITALGKTFSATCLSMGNPHCVIFVKSLAPFPVERFGPVIENLPIFPQRTNVEFARVLHRGEVEVRIWERGVGETLACGTGTSAVAVAGVLTGRTDRKIHIHLLGGDLQVDFRADGCVYLTGPAKVVFQGQWAQ